MSLTQAVIDLVAERGRATVDDLCAELAEEGYTRHQVKRSLQNARFRGLLTCTRGKGLGKGSEPGTYEVKVVQAPVSAPIRPVASVWQLGA